MNIKGWIKRFWLKVLNKIEERLAGFMAGVIILVGLVLCAIFWEWAKAKHSLEVSGWVWLLLCLMSLFLLLHFVSIVFAKVRKIKDPADIRNVLYKWWRHTKERCPGQIEFTLYFSSIDKKERLEKGSAKKHLRQVVTKDGKWGVVREGPDTLMVRRDPPDMPAYTE